MQGVGEAHENYIFNILWKSLLSAIVSGLSPNLTSLLSIDKKPTYPFASAKAPPNLL
jgi:hypothetical protein